MRFGLSIQTGVRQILLYTFLGLVHGYRWFLSPFMGGRCRFEPSCSSYALEALRLHGPWYGLYLVVARIGRCRPGGGMGYDPVPMRTKPSRPELLETSSGPDQEGEQ
ncbi:MAG: membrane protein insertion efficiency factor YidD [Myxococcales bacterium]|nr:membrane protein insertion efficiency factor YidD [Myxococcales bacterium]